MKNRQMPLGGALLVLVLSTATLGWWLWKQPEKSTEPEKPEWVSDSSRSTPHEDHLAQNTNSHHHHPHRSASQTQSAIDAFENYLARYFNADPATRDQLTEEGVTLAQRRRPELKSLIQEDPQAALAKAIPYELRRQLPSAIIEHLETPVSDYASYDLITYDLFVNDSGHDHTHEDTLMRLASIEESRYKVFTYGRRLNVTTKERLSLHGMAIDEVLAMGEYPVRPLSQVERQDWGFSSPRVVAVGNDYYQLTDEAALNRLLHLLRQDEETLGPRPGRLHWELRRDEVEGVSLLLSEDAIGLPEEFDFTELESPYTEGAKTMLYIRARFSDEEADHEPIDLDTLKERQAGAEAFWYENSYGKSSLTTTFTDTITLPYSASYYVDHGLGAMGPLFEDALPLAKMAGQDKNQDWDADNYDFYTMITTGQHFPFGGIANLGGRRSYLNGAGASWGGTASHEFGHNLGLSHANYWYTDSTSPIGRDSIPGGYAGDEEGDEWVEYGHSFSVMGSTVPELEEGEGHYTTGAKVKLNWLVASDGDWVSVNQSTATPIRLYRHDVKSEDFSDMLTGVVRAIKIDLDSGDYAATDKRRYWLSYRRRPAFGVEEGAWWPPYGVAGDWLPYGLQVDWQREEYGWDGSILLDMTPYSRDSPFIPIQSNSDNRDKQDAVLVIGRTYSDKIADIHITPIAYGGENPNEWIEVLINIGTQEQNTDPEITSFTASSTAVERGEMVDFSVEAEDPDGDTLYYAWTFEDGDPQTYWPGNIVESWSDHWEIIDEDGHGRGTVDPDSSMVVESLNSNKASKSWRENNVETVRVTVSDGKGGSDSKAIYVIVGQPNRPFAIRGRVIAGGFPVQGARVSVPGRQAWTDGDGNYALFHLGRYSLRFWPAAADEKLLRAEKAGMRFEPLFVNPVLSSKDADTLGRDWVAMGDGPVSGSLQLAVTPYETEIKLRSQIEYRALAWDASGKRIEAKPTWSANRGGPISQSGLFTPTQAGGLFRIIATQGLSQAHANVEVTANPFDYFMLDYPGIAVEDRGHDADPDGDGRTNLVEYAMGGTPDVSEAYSNLLTWFRLDKFDKDASWRSYVRYQRRKDAALYGLRYELQLSTDLSDWWTLDDTWRVTSVDEIFEEVSTSPRSWYIPRVFYRMKIYLDE